MSLAVCDTYEIQPHRHLQQIEGSHDYMWSFWIVPARLSDRCRSVYATSETYHQQLQINYIVENVTLTKYAKKIQQAWRAHHIRRKNAIQLIQTQFRKSIYDPTYVLCRRRLVREFSELQMNFRCWCLKLASLSGDSKSWLEILKYRIEYRLLCDASERSSPVSRHRSADCNGRSVTLWVDSTGSAVMREVGRHVTRTQFFDRTTASYCVPGSWQVCATLFMSVLHQLGISVTAPHSASLMAKLEDHSPSRNVFFKTHMYCHGV